MTDAFSKMWNVPCIKFKIILFSEIALNTSSLPAHSKPGVIIRFSSVSFENQQIFRFSSVSFENQVQQIIRFSSVSFENQVQQIFRFSSVSFENQVQQIFRFSSVSFENKVQQIIRFSSVSFENQVQQIILKVFTSFIWKPKLQLLNNFLPTGDEQQPTFPKLRRWQCA